MRHLESMDAWAVEQVRRDEGGKVRAVAGVAIVEDEEDAAFIAHAPTDIAYLLRVVDEAKHMLAQLDSDGTHGKAALEMCCGIGADRLRKLLDEAEG